MADEPIAATAQPAPDAVYAPRRRTTNIYLGILVVITLAGLASIAQDPAGLDLVVVAALAYFWYLAAFRMAYAIEVSGEKVVFRILAQKRTTTLAAIGTVATQGGNWTVVKYNRGRERVDLLGSVQGLDEFAARVKAANAKVAVKGV